MSIFVYRGLPGSGKTTAAKNVVGLHPETYVRVNRDDIRAAQGITTGVGTPDQEAIVTAMEDAAIVAAVKAGFEVIVDATNLNNQSVKRFFAMHKRVIFVDFPTPIAKAIKQDAYRHSMGGRGVGEAVIRKIAKRFKVAEGGTLPKPPKAPERPDLTPVGPWQYDLPSAIIVDIDGTLADHRDVRNVYDTSKYHLDGVHGSVAAIVNTLAESQFMLVVSGRDAAFRGVTAEWLRSQNVHADKLFMRPEGDRRPDDVIKAEIYENNIRGRYNVLGVFDDRGRVLRMWRAKGLTTFAVGDTDNYNF